MNSKQEKEDMEVELLALESRKTRDISDLKKSIIMLDVDCFI